jgi:hypothetical protein
MKVKPEGNVVPLLAYMKKENKALKLLVQSLFDSQLMIMRGKKNYEKDLGSICQMSC